MSTSRKAGITQSKSDIRIPHAEISEDQKSRLIAENPTAAVREKLRWLDERDCLDRLAREVHS